MHLPDPLPSPDDELARGRYSTDEWDEIMRVSAQRSLAHTIAVTDRILDEYVARALDEWLMPLVDDALSDGMSDGDGRNGA